VNEVKSRVVSIKRAFVLGKKKPGAGQLSCIRTESIHLHEKSAGRARCSRYRRRAARIPWSCCRRREVAAQREETMLVNRQRDIEEPGTARESMAMQKGAGKHREDGMG
jgi:hypothetical protein